MRISKEKQEETKRLYELENAIMRLKKEKAYQDVKEFFTPREISYLRRKMEREGC